MCLRAEVLSATLESYGDPFPLSCLESDTLNHFPRYIAHAVPKLTGSRHLAASAFLVAGTTGLCYCTRRVYAICKSTSMPQNFTANLVLEAVLQGVPILFSHLAAVPMAIPPLQTS